MNERLKHEGLLSRKKMAAANLRLRISGDLTAVRDILDPFAPIEELRMDVAAAQMVEMAAKHSEYIGLLAEISSIERALGLE